MKNIDFPIFAWETPKSRVLTCEIRKKPISLQ